MRLTGDRTREHAEDGHGEHTVAEMCSEDSVKRIILNALQGRWLLTEEK